MPQGETWQVDRSLNLSTLTIAGVLLWDQSKAGLVLNSSFVLVTPSGKLQIGSKAFPMDQPATIYIAKGPFSDPLLGTRFLGGNGGVIQIHGRRMQKTWTLLSATARVGSTVLQLKDDPRVMQWRIGDRIGIATTTLGLSTQHRISALGPGSAISIQGPLQATHWGGYKAIGNRRFELAAEVVNLERSVLITGDHDDFDTSFQGLHTIMTGGGYMDLRYTRVEYCGQRMLLGRYCLHFHRMKRCPSCVFQGNAVVNSMQGGITVHDTHQALVDQNIMWDTRAWGIYVEDGNEMNNTFSRNVIICSQWPVCSVDWAAGANSQVAGIFVIGMTNNFIENRIAGHENSIWTIGSFHGQGQGFATGKICPVNAPFLTFRGNVHHDNQRFGIYLDDQNPKRLSRDGDGYVTDMKQCNPFDSNGNDQGFVVEIHDDVNWHNGFVGQYALGDIQFVNFTSVNNYHAMYWKASKNFVDGRLWHIRDSTFANDPNDGIGVLQFLGPGGPFVFGILNTVFIGSGPPGCGGVICINHDCGLGGAGGPCNTQYLLQNVDFSGIPASAQRIHFGSDPGAGIDEAFVSPVFLSTDNSLGGYRSIVSGYMNGFGACGCCEQLGQVWGFGFGCSAAVRRLNLWAPQSLGQLLLAGPGYRQVSPNLASPVDGRNAGFLSYEPSHGGYGALALVGQNYSLSLQSGNWPPGDSVVEFSDVVLGTAFGKVEALVLTVGNKSCDLRSSDARPFLAPNGQSMPWGWPLVTSSRQHLISTGRLRCAGQR